MCSSSIIDQIDVNIEKKITRSQWIEKNNAKGETIRISERLYKQQ